MWRCLPTMFEFRLCRIVSGTSPASCTAMTYAILSDRPRLIWPASMLVAVFLRYDDCALKMSAASSITIISSGIDASNSRCAASGFENFRARPAAPRSSRCVRKRPYPRLSRW